VRRGGGTGRRIELIKLGASFHVRARRYSAVQQAGDGTKKLAEEAWKHRARNAILLRLYGQHDRMVKVPNHPASRAEAIPPQIALDREADALRLAAFRAGRAAGVVHGRASLGVFLARGCTFLHTAQIDTAETWKVQFQEKGWD
jgi:hypothetical protein